MNKIVYNNKTFNNSQGMADAMNHFFVNIGASVEAKIPLAERTFSSYLVNKNPSSIFLHACSHDEIGKILKSFCIGKACGPFNIPTNILKDFSIYFDRPTNSYCQ